MGPSVVEKRLQARGKGSTKLQLQSMVIRPSIVLRNAKSAEEIGIWPKQFFLPQKISSSLPDIGYGNDLLPCEGLFQGQIPLIGARKLQIRRECLHLAVRCHC